MKKMMLLIVVVFMISCRKDKDPILPHVYHSQDIVTNLPPVMGGCIDGSGNLMSISVPIYDGSWPYKELLTAKVHRMNGSGNDQIFYDFKNKYFSTASSYISLSQDSMANMYEWIPGGLRINLAKKDDISYFMSFNAKDKISILSASGQLEIPAQMGINSLISNGHQGAYYITSPVFTNGNTITVKSPPVIYEIDSLNTITQYFKFPDNLQYSSAGLVGIPGAFYPTDILIDLAMDNQKNIYVSFGLDNIIYKIDRQKVFSTYRDDIFCPTSIAFDKNNVPFIASAPRFKKAGQKMIKDKPVEVFLIDKGGDRKIYEGNKADKQGGFMPTKTGEFYTINDATFNLSINTNNEIFLEDPLEGKVVLIK